MKKLILFARDPGGANTIIPLVKKLPKQGYKVSLFGKDTSLVKYRENKLPRHDILKSIKTVSPAAIRKFLKKEKPDGVITGTSANDFTEKYLWREAAKLGIPSFAILDHWSNYGIRFSRYGVIASSRYNRSRKLEYLPDRIFVMDDYARDEMMKVGIKKEKIVVSGQPYFELMREKLKKISAQRIKDFKIKHRIKPDARTIVFASEPLTEDQGSTRAAKNYFGFTETSILNELFSALKKVSLNKKNIYLIIKPHPRESIEKFHKIIRENKTEKFTIKLIKTCSVWELMKASDLICGMFSMFLIEAAILKQPVLSLQIGAGKKSQFILEKRGILKPIKSQRELQREIKKALNKSLAAPKNFKIITDPTKRIINYLNNFYASTSYQRRTKNPL